MRVAADAQHVFEHDARLPRRLQRLRQDDEIEGVVGIILEIGVGVALHHGKALGDAFVDALARQFDAAAVDAARFQKAQQFAVAAADIEHARARLHHIGDDQQVDARAARAARRAPAMVRSYLRRDEHRYLAGRPRAFAAPSRKPRTIANSSGSSSRKASWPLSVVISANETRAPAALSACTMARDSGGRKQPVAGERDHAEPRRRAAEGVGGDAVIVGGEIEIIHRPGEIEIGIGVEPLDEGDALVAQIELHLKIGVEREGRVVAILKTAAEFAVQRGIGQISDVRAHARDREPAPRIGAFGKIAAAAPFRIGHHRLAADFVEGDVLRRMPRRRRDRQRREYALRIARRPLQHLHAAHRAADRPRTASRCRDDRAASPGRAPCRAR